MGKGILRGKPLAMLMLAFALLFVGACQSGGNEAKESANNSGGASATADASSGEATDTQAESASAQPIDPLGKFDPPIQVTSAKISYPTVTYQSGEDENNNVWTRLYQEKLGIDVNFVWTVPEDQFQAKMTAAFASQDIPDIMNVDERSFKTYLDSNLAMDLTDVFDQYASDLLKQIYAGELGQENLDYARVNGRLMGLPAPLMNPVEGGNVLYVRTDWLQKLNLPEPQTMEDVYKISAAFANGDPDGNGKKDTFGLAVAKDLVASPTAGGIGDLVGFYNGFHLYPGLWQEDAAGNLVNGFVNPELKKPLAKLQEMYKNGEIDKEFGVKDRWKVGEDIAAGKIGMFYGVNWAVFVALIGNHKADPNADWKSFPIPSLDGERAKVSGKPLYPNVYVVRKDFAHPEALIKLANLSVETLYGEYAQQNSIEVGETYQTVRVGDNAYTVSAYQIVSMFPGDKNLRQAMDVNDVFVNGADPAKLVSEAQGLHEYLVKWNNGERDDVTWQMKYINDVNLILANDYYKNNLVVTDRFRTIQTEKMAEKQKSLDDLATTVFTKIIMGESVDAFDKFVQDWTSLGGADITREVNDWYKTTK